MQKYAVNPKKWDFLIVSQLPVDLNLGGSCCELGFWKAEEGFHVDCFSDSYGLAGRGVFRIPVDWRPGTFESCELGSHGHHDGPAEPPSVFMRTRRTWVKVGFLRTWWASGYGYVDSFQICADLVDFSAFIAWPARLQPPHFPDKEEEICVVWKWVWFLPIAEECDWQAF